MYSMLAHIILLPVTLTFSWKYNTNIAPVHILAIITVLQNANIFAFTNRFFKTSGLKSTKHFRSNLQPKHTTMMFGTWHGSGGVYQL